jgi:protein-L-isoaspartate(D-aspartate) O-methyltransferase
MELKDARFNMIEQQIRPWDVLDQAVLDLIAEVPREDFVPEPYRNLAYADIAVPLGHGQVMMHPKIEARLLQALDLHPTDSVLEVGTGSGYLTALLARSAHHVYSVDIIPAFKAQAEEKLAVHGIDNVTLEVGDAARGWPRHGLYDVIAITGSVLELPSSFLQSLNRGGRLFAVVGAAPIMEAVLIRRVGDSEWSRESLFETELPRLINAPVSARFVF